MRNKWYGDKRDLVKWSVLIQLAKRTDSVRILQIAYFREDYFEGIEIDGKTFDMPPEVEAHFRDIRKIEKLTSKVKISVFDRVFGERDLYLRQALDFIDSFSHEKCIVFLDPDTGLEPANHNHNHVLDQELTAIWGKLKIADILVFYQHQNNRNGEEWIQPKKLQFETAIGVPAKIAYGPKIAHDVVFFYAQKV